MITLSGFKEATKAAGKWGINHSERFGSLVWNRSAINLELKKLKLAGMPREFLNECRNVYIKSYEYEWPKITEGYLLLVQTGNITNENMDILSKCAGKYLPHPLDKQISVLFVAQDLVDCKKSGETPQQVYEGFLLIHKLNFF